MPLFGGPNIAALEAKRDVEGLIKALTSKDPTIKIAAADALGPMRDPAAVEPLTALVADEDPGVRRSAVRALMARGGVRVVEPLLVALQDRDESVRQVAAQAVYKRLMTDSDMDARLQTVTGLGRIKPGGAAEPLIKSMQDPDETIRVASMRSLAALGDPSAVLPILTVLAGEQRRARQTGRSSLAVERAAGQALDTLCTDRAIDALQEALASEDAEVREGALKRLARIASPAVTDTLVARLDDPDPVLARSSARGLAEIRWQPPDDQMAAKLWSILHEWRRLAAHGEAAVVYLTTALPDAPVAERNDILKTLAELNWQPPEANEMAARYWAIQGNWDKAVEVGEAAVPVLDEFLGSTPRWRDRVSVGLALAKLGQERTVPFGRVDLIQRVLEILDGEAEAEEKRGSMTTLLIEEHQYEKSGKSSVGWCDCGYPTARVKKDGSRELFEAILGAEPVTADTIYYCPNCGTRQSTVI